MFLRNKGGDMFFSEIILFFLINNINGFNDHNDVFLNQYKEFIESDRIDNVIIFPGAIGLNLTTCNTHAVFEKGILKPDAKFFRYDGNFKPLVFKEFLKYISDEKIINNPHFFNINQLDVRDMTGVLHGGNSAQIFIIKVRQKGVNYRYLMRKMSSWGEAIRLNKRLQNIKLRLFVSKSLKNKGLPVLVFPMHLFQVISNTNQVNFVFISHYVKGQTLAQLLTETLSFKEQILDAFYVAGKALANFHIHFMNKHFKTAVHGDFSLHNVIIDKDKRVFFVDNEGIVYEEYKKQVPYCDVRHCLIYSLIGIVNKFDIQEYEKNRIIIIFLKKFLQGHLMAFDIQLRKTIYIGVRNYILNELQSFSPRYAKIIEWTLFIKFRHFDGAEGNLIDLVLRLKLFLIYSTFLKNYYANFC